MTTLQCNCTITEHLKSTAEFPAINKQWHLVWFPVIIGGGQATFTQCRESKLHKRIWLELGCVENAEEILRSLRLWHSWTFTVQQIRKHRSAPCWLSLRVRALFRDVWCSVEYSIQICLFSNKGMGFFFFFFTITLPCIYLRLTVLQNLQIPPSANTSQRFTE